MIRTPRLRRLLPCCVSSRFNDDYVGCVLEPILDEYGAVAHWAKQEVPKDPERLAKLQQRLRRRFPVERFNAARRRLDPHGVLSNVWLDTLLGAADAAS